jgi:hypothetical protein
VTFDLSELAFISSLAMGTLVSYRRTAVRAGTRVCLSPELRPAVREALERAELLSLFEAVGGSAPRSPRLEDVERTHGVTWPQLVELEPEVEALLWRARQVGAGCRTLPAAEGAFGLVRNELAGLVGFAGKHHRHPVLGRVGAYEVAYWKLHDAVAGLLPDRAAPRDEAEFIGGLGI